MTRLCYSTELLICFFSSHSRYSLSIIQQPTRAAEFGANVLSRLPLAPPLIVKLEVKDAEGNDLDM